MPQDFRRDRGAWRYAFEYKGKKYSKLGFRTKKAAMLAEAEERKKLAIAWRPRGAEDKITLAEWVELWLADHVKAHCRPRTVDEYRRSLERHILPALGTTPLIEVSRVQLRGHFAQLAATGLADATVKNALVPLRACFNAAIEDGHLETNPATFLGKQVRARTEEDALEVQAYSKEELDAILERAPLEIRTLARTGIRLGELLGLRRDDLDDGFIWIRRNIQWLHAEPLIMAPKSGKARRVDVPHDLLAELAQASDLYLFGHEAPWRPEKVRRTWRALLDTFWVHRPLRVHDLRHTYAALLLGAGAPPSYVKEQLGHASIQITLDVYGHLIPGANRKWIDETFGGSLPVVPHSSSSGGS